MFNNAVLDVFIGLVLIYLLYSLFITILSEMIVTWLNLRSRILRVSIEKMLNDGLHARVNAGKNFLRRTWNIIERFFLKEFEDFKYSLAGKFYAAPSIKYLSDNGGEKKTTFTQSKPSYISADMFADTLIQLLKDKGVGATDIEKVNFCLQFNTHHIDPDSLKNLRDYAEKAGTDIGILKERFKAWFNETQDRATGWYKKKLQLILFWLGLIVAVIFNVDSIQIAKILSKDKDARSQLVQMGIALSKDSAKYKEFVSHGDTIHAQPILDSGYARVTKDIEQAGMILGLGWETDKLIMPYDLQYEKKSDSIKLKNVLGKVGNFNSLRDSIHNLNDAINNNDAVIQNVLRITKELGIDTIRRKLQLAAVTGIVTRESQQVGLKKIQDSILALVDSIKIIQAKKSLHSLDLATASAGMDSIVHYIDSMNGNSKRIVAINSILFDTLKSGGDQKASKPDIVAIKIEARKKYPWYKKLFYVTRESFTTLRLIGLFITALMLSLGAPFWFDLLKKLVAIRGAGVKPEEKAPAKKNNTTEVVEPSKKSSAPVYNTTDPVEIALSIHRKELEIIPGVISVQYDYLEDPGKKKIPCIEVVVVEHCEKSLIPAEYKVTVNDKDQIVKVVVKDGKPATLHVSKEEGFGLRVKNKINTDPESGWGSVAGIVLNARTKKKAILSCSHVLAGNNIDNKLDGELDIINGDNKTKIATLTFNLHSHVLDVAYADTIDAHAKDYQIIHTYDEVVRSDGEFETKVRMHGFVSGDQEGNIINYRTDYPFLVNGNSFTMVNLIKMRRKENGKDVALSQEGDSGALIVKLDDNNNEIPIGMVIGGTSEYSFAISLKEIFNTQLIEPIKKI